MGPFRFLVMLAVLLSRATPADCDWHMTQAWQRTKAATER